MNGLASCTWSLPAPHHRHQPGNIKLRGTAELSIRAGGLGAWLPVRYGEVFRQEVRQVMSRVTDGAEAWHLGFVIEAASA